LKFLNVYDSAMAEEGHIFSFANYSCIIKMHLPTKRCVGNYTVLAWFSLAALSNVLVIKDMLERVSFVDSLKTIRVMWREWWKAFLEIVSSNVSLMAETWHVCTKSECV
jgi:hypothetical protein